MKNNLNGELNNPTNKKSFSRQKSINPNITTLKMQNNLLNQNQIKSRNNLEEIQSKITQKNNTHNTKISKEYNKNENIIVIKNESSYLVLESFLNEHQIKYTSIFILYLSEIWRELSLYSMDYNLGIIPFAFSRFFPLPGLISKR